MKKERKYVSMDWAAKKLLRSKANYDILEGFLSELLKEDITILSIAESEANKEAFDDKWNRVDLLVQDSKERRIIVEIQFEHEVDYFQRILFGVSKALVENMKEGQPYAEVSKVISVSIVYFDLGQGKDYIYHGQTQFTGIHQGDELALSAYQKSLFKAEKVCAFFPEFYLLKINQFNDIAKDSLDEWIYFLKNEEIKGEFRAKGLQAAKQKLDVMKLSEPQRRAYEEHIENQRYRASMMEYSVKRAETESQRADELSLRADELSRRADELSRRADELSQRLEEESRRAEEESRRAEEESRRAEEQSRKVEQVSERAVRALMAQGLSESQAREQLGLL
jgi:predicted transposase/invertase (TIGR01784 family)